MIKKYYEPIKGLYVDVLHLTENTSSTSVSANINKICDRARVSKIDNEGFNVSLDDSKYKRGFTFVVGDYVIFDKKNANIKVIQDASSELEKFMEEYLEI